MNCRLCLEHKNQTDHIYFCSIEGQSLKIQSAIEIYFWPLENITESCWICRQCWEYLSQFNDFYLRVQRAHEVLTNDTNKSEADTIIETTASALTKSEATEEIITNNPPIVKRGRGRPRKIVTDSADASQMNRIEERATEQMTIPFAEGNFEQIDANDDIMDCSKSDVESEDDNKKCSDPLTKQSRLKRKIICKFEKEGVVKSKEPRRQKIPSQKTRTSRQFDEIIAEYFKLSCCLCQKPLADFSELKAHFSMQHNTQGYVLCCGKKLLRRGVIVDHIRVHQDPEYFKCPRCEKVMADRRCLELHLKAHKEKRERSYQCTICSKIFHRRVVFMRHQNLHLPEDQKTISCPQCDKKFVTKYNMNQHLKIVHLNMYSKICDICGKSIRSNEGLKRHQEEHANVQRAPIQCELCGITLTTKYGLSKHMKARHTAEYLTPQQCAICSKVSPSKMAHQRHMWYMHRTERRHQCSLCEKAFKRATELREHMTIHTGEVLYTCPHCPKTFNSNANMHSHRKKKHRKEWEEKRLQKYQKTAATNSITEIIDNATTPDETT